MKKSNNQKKPIWYASTSRVSMLRQIRGIDLLSWFDVYQPDKASIRACEEDILGFVNRECRAVRLKLKPKIDKQKDE